MPDFHDRVLALVAGKERTPILAAAPAVKGDETTAVLRLYDPIDDWGGEWGVSSKEFATVLDELPDTVTEIRLLINSPGGIVFEGVAILNQLRAHAARVVAVVEGVAASAASFIAAGVDELVMAPNSELFIHRAWGLCVGNAEDMTQIAGELEHFDRNLASIYQAKAGGTVDDWLAAMSAETWYSAEEAVAVGLADSVDKSMADATPAKNRVDLSIFKNSGRPAASGPQHTDPPVPGSGEKGGSTMDPVQLRTSLGLAENATDEDVAEEVTAGVAAKEQVTAAEARATAAEARVAELEKKQTPEGFESVPKGTGEQLTAASARIEALEKKEQTRERDAFLAKWQRKFLPAARAEIEQTFDTIGAEALAALFDKSPDVLPLEAIGTEAHDLDSQAERDYIALFGPEKTEVTA